MQMGNKLNGKLLKSLAVTGLVILVIYIYASDHPCCQLSSTTTLFINANPKQHKSTPSINNIGHIVFGIAGLSKTWGNRRWYVESWWSPNKTRGFVFLDKPPNFPWPPSSPPFRISEDNSRYTNYQNYVVPFNIRMVRMIEETFEAEESKGVRWYVMADDDTVFFVDNLVEVLSKYDHTKYFYIGMPSECVVSNFVNSFEMGFGGAGYALSYPLAKAMAKNMDLCIKRYPNFYGSDHVVQSCIADFGVPLTKEKGFHQIDLHRDISGFLSAHPQSPLVSLHHFDAIDPIFPSMNRHEALTHLMRAAKLDQSRLLQQSVCYHKQNNWTFSVSWAYAVQIYEQIIPPSILQKPIATFIPWKKGAQPPFMFDTRGFKDNPCEVPHVLFFDNVEKARMNHFVTTYTKRSSRGLAIPCSSSGNHSAEFVSKIRVLSSITKLLGGAGRRECCDVVQLVGMDSLGIKLRACVDDEII